MIPVKRRGNGFGLGESETRKGRGMEDSRIAKAAVELFKAMDQVVDDSLPREIANVVKFHSKGAAIAAVAGGWIPGIGGAAAVAVSAGFVWRMYGKINSKLDLKLSKSVVKSVASAVATNLAAGAVGGIVLSIASSLLPGVGSVGATAIAGGVCYALTLTSGFVYLKILTNVFKAGEDPTSMTADKLKKVAKDVVKNENIKAVMKEAKADYKAVKESGELDGDGYEYDEDEDEDGYEYDEDEDEDEYEYDDDEDEDE